jgi:hypothetical protein
VLNFSALKPNYRVIISVDWIEKLERGMLVESLFTAPTTGKERLSSIPEICSFYHGILVSSVMATRGFEMIELLLTTFRTSVLKPIPIISRNPFNPIFRSIIVDNTNLKSHSIRLRP